MSPSTVERRPEMEISVRSLLVPLHGLTLLVPNALVSEVATLGEILPAAGPLPEWLLGTIDWRGLRLPLLAFERVVGDDGVEPSRTSRAIVLNTLNGNRQLPFVALLSQRIPRLLLVTGRMLHAVEGAPPGDGVLVRARLHETDVIVPDMDRLEQLLVQHGMQVERVVD